SLFFSSDATPSPAIYTLSLHDALPISPDDRVQLAVPGRLGQVDAELLQRLVRVLGVLAGDPGAAADLAERLEQGLRRGARRGQQDRKSTRLNSSHDQISYAVFCLKKKK